MASSRKHHLLLVGLGNISHPRTRHSIGQQIIGTLAAQWRTTLVRDRQGLLGTHVMKLNDGPLKFTLFIPSAAMNNSGKSVIKVCNGTVGTHRDMVVIHDSLEHEPSVLSYKSGGSAQGHNGVRSVIAATGGHQDFHRLRIGIGRDHATDPADYVLKFVPREENMFWGPSGEGLQKVLDEIFRIANVGAKTQ